MNRLSRADMRYFQKAHQAAEISDYKRTHVGCVAVYQGNIIGIACNTNKTHPMQKYYNRYRYHPQTSYFYPKLHVEINCISSIRHLDINFSKVEHTDMTADFIEEIKDREYYMFSEEAKERHIVDKIIGIDCDIDEII